MKKFSLLVFIALFICTGAIAQDDMKPVKHENSTWYRVVLVNFKQGKVERAKEIIKEYQEAGKVAETPAPKMMWLITGEYDMMLIWKFENGPSDLEWKWSPNSVKWWKEFIKQQGSQDAAKELSAEYADLVSNSTSYIARKDK